eukprot:gene13397-17964_t
MENETLTFYNPEKIIPLSSGNWGRIIMNQLKVEVAGVNLLEFFAKFNIIHDDKTMKCSSRAEKIIMDLTPVDLVFLDAYRNLDEIELENLRNSPLHCQPLCKVLFLISKYYSCEALVDSFINTLLIELGYNKEMLYTIPQFKMKLHFGEGNVKESTPDFVVMDILSYLKMQLVFSTNESKIDQINKKARIEKSFPSDDFALGVRVNGTVFHFHAVPRSKEVLKSMETLNVASTPTRTFILGDENEFNFLNNLE